PRRIVPEKSRMVLPERVHRVAIAGPERVEQLAGLRLVRGEGRTKRQGGDLQCWCPTVAATGVNGSIARVNGICCCCSNCSMPGTSGQTIASAMIMIG